MDLSCGPGFLTVSLGSIPRRLLGSGMLMSWGRLPPQEGRGARVPCASQQAWQRQPLSSGATFANLAGENAIELLSVCISLMAMKG